LRAPIFRSWLLWRFRQHTSDHFHLTNLHVYPAHVMKLPHPVVLVARAVRFQRARRLVGAFVALTVTFASAPLRVQAQPEGDSLIVPDDAATGVGVTIAPVETPAQKAARADREVEERDRALWQAARLEMGGPDGVNEGQKPAQTIAAYAKWLGDHGDLHPLVRAEAGVALARLQGQNGDRAGAGATLEALWNKGKEGDGALLVRAAQASLVLNAPNQDKGKAGAGAQALLEPLVGRAIASSRARFESARELLQRYADALAAQGQGAQMAQFATKVLLGAPEHLPGTAQNQGGWLYGATVGALLGETRPEAAGQALSWAKLSWVECSFDKSSITDASRLVAQALSAQPDGEARVAGWIKAQKDPALANPLQGVALPPTDDRALPGLLSTLGKDEQSREARVGVLLWMGRDHEAMAAAVAGAGKIPEWAKGQRLDVMRGVARVFKARDLSLKSGNAYLQWVSKPVGDNPVDVFLAQAPAKEGAVTQVATAPEVATAPAQGGTP